MAQLLYIRPWEIGLLTVQQFYDAESFVEQTARIRAAE